MAPITETTTQDKPRNHESGQDQTQKRVTLLCQMFQYGASKASRLVRKYESLTRLGHAADTDEAYVEYLVNAAVITTERAHTEALSFLMHSDPTGNAATRNADAAAAGTTLQAAWAARRADVEYQDAASVAGLARHQIVRGDAA